MEEELKKFKAEIHTEKENSKRRNEEYGDVLFSLINYA